MKTASPTVIKADAFLRPIRILVGNRVRVGDFAFSVNARDQLPPIPLSFNSLRMASSDSSALK